MPTTSKSASTPFLDVGFFDAGQKQRNRDIILYTELLNQVEGLKNIADAFVPEFRALCFRHFSKIGAVYNHAAGAWTYKAGNKIQQGGFAFAEGP